MMRVGVIFPPAEASRVTSRMEAIAPRKAPKVIPNADKILLVVPKTMTAAAPVEAPEEIPRI